MTLPSFATVDMFPGALDEAFGPSSAVVTPLAALANDDIAAADNGGIPSIDGGGGRSDEMLSPFVLGGSGSPPAVTGNADASAARRVSGVPGPLSLGVLTPVGFKESFALRALVPSSRHRDWTDRGTDFGFLLGPGPSAPSSPPTSDADYTMSSVDLVRQSKMHSQLAGPVSLSSSVSVAHLGNSKMVARSCRYVMSMIFEFALGDRTYRFAGLKQTLISCSSYFSQPWHALQNFLLG